MIIKGHSSTGRGLGAYLLHDKNARAEVWDIRGDLPRGLSETLNDWRSVTLGTACTKPLYHAQLNPDRVLSPDEWQTALAIFEKEMGFENQPRAVVLHEHKGREHLHLVYLRIGEDGKAIPDSWNYLHHEKAARGIEQKLGLETTKGAFTARDHSPRPDRTPSRDDIQQGERLGTDPKAIKAAVSTLYRQADTGQALVAALSEAGYSLAQGDRRAYVILDPTGGTHSLTRMTGARAADLSDRLHDYPLESLPTVDEAREAQRPAKTAGETDNGGGQAHSPTLDDYRK